MIEAGIGLPGQSVEDVRAAAEAADEFDFASFSVYGDLGDLSPYAVLHASADLLKEGPVRYVGPMGVPVGMQHPEVIATHAKALEEQLPGQSSIGLVRGAFMEQIGARPATLAQLEATVNHIRNRFEPGEVPPIFLGGFGPKLLQMAGRLGVTGVKLGGSANPALAERARSIIDNPDVRIVLGAVSVIDSDRGKARALARTEVAKYLDVVGDLDPTLDGHEQASLAAFKERFKAGDPSAGDAISDALLDKFALAGTPSDALEALERMGQSADRFEFGTHTDLVSAQTLSGISARPLLAASTGRYYR
jgi:5,10-methylenetetrahydromethanopterin reductase